MGGRFLFGKRFLGLPNWLGSAPPMGALPLLIWLGETQRSAFEMCHARCTCKTLGKLPTDLLINLYTLGRSSLLFMCRRPFSPLIVARML